MKAAYVALYFGGNASLLEALVMGHTLKESGTSYDRLILCRRDVDAKRKELLSQFFKVITIDPFPLEGNEYSDDCVRRYHGVFDKLYGWALTEYEKVVFLDVDMLIFQNCDKLFELDTPATTFMYRDHGWDFNGKITPDEIRASMRLKPGGIMNIGTLVLTPNALEFARLEHSLRAMVSRGEQFTCPEQDFLREHFIENWTTIDTHYNWPPIHYAWGSQRKMWGRDLSSIPMTDHHIFHYYWMWKPLQWKYQAETLKPVLFAHHQSKIIEDTFELLNKNIKLETITDNPDCRFKSIMGEWFKALEEVNNIVGFDLVESYFPEPLFTPEEAKNLIQRASKNNRKNSHSERKSSSPFRLKRSTAQKFVIPS